MAKLLEPRVLKGFRDALPEGPQGAKRRLHFIQTLGQVFELGGFDPIDTPALELSELLLGKAGGETEKQIYRFQDNGGRDVALRFDLTVPFSRFVVQYAAKLDFPFKRYHIAKVWRGENAQHGRYREFYQCDFDIVGDESVLADLLILQTAHQSLSCLQSEYPALGPLRIHVSHRGLLSSLWQLCDVAAEQCTLALRIIDKLHKIGADAMYIELQELLGTDIATILWDYLGLSNQRHLAPAQPNRFAAELTRLEKLLETLSARGILGHEQIHTAQALGQRSIRELRQIADFAAQSDIALQFDPSIARGLDYYTGMVFETFLEQLPTLGSVCSGGRYDQLTQLYSKSPLPGVGGSIGLDRLLTGLEKLEARQETAVNTAYCESYVIISVDPNWKDCPASLFENLSLRLSQGLQNHGIICDVIPRRKKISSLFQRAEGKACRYLLLLQPDRNWQLRDLKLRSSWGTANINEIISHIKSGQIRNTSKGHRNK